MKAFTRVRAESVASLGEERLIARIRRWLGSAGRPAPEGIGDDCAVLPGAAPRSGAKTGRLLTVDPVIHGRHFDDRVPPAAVGAKLLNRNLSDIAAMGGAPEAAVVALCLDPRTRLAWLEAFYRGLAAGAKRHGVAIVGGDVSRADGVLAASLTLLGRTTAPRGAVLRTGARTGDWIYVTGVLGGSVASGHHWRFTPRLAEGAWLARRPEVRAMMDVSDGLAKDLRAMQPPGATPAVFASALPLRPGADLRSALGEGEDYELLLAVDRAADPAALERAWRRAFPRVRLTRIGHFIRAGSAAPDTLALDRYHGYEHFR